MSYLAGSVSGMTRPQRSAVTVVHVPHASRVIPPKVRVGIVLSDEALEFELDQMTDSFTDVLVARALDGVSDGPEVIAAPVSRLVVDVERFPDEREAMNAVGMGAVYTRTHDGAVLREEIDPTLVGCYQEPHARAVAEAVTDRLEARGQALVIDVHSYPSAQLPYEMAEPGAERPEICLGVDEVHTPPELVARARDAFEGFEIAINSPFAGAYVPLRYYGREPRVAAIMIEIRRDTYMDEESMELSDGVERVVAGLRKLLTPWV